MNLKLSGDVVWRLITGKRVDTNKRNKDNSFIARYGHIQLKKISEDK